jgi:hypothetical protein
METNMTKLLLASVAIVAALSTSARAEATWAWAGNWRIYSDRNYCGATVNYGRQGKAIVIGEGKAGWALTIGGVNGRNGHWYKVKVRSSNGQYGTFQGYYSNSAITFGNLDMTSIVALAASQGITISGIGSFDLTNSSNAIMQVHQCWTAMTSAYSRNNNNSDGGMVDQGVDNSGESY